MITLKVPAKLSLESYTLNSKETMKMILYKLNDNSKTLINYHDVLKQTFASR